VDLRSYNILCYATCADEVYSYTTHLLLQLGRLEMELRVKCSCVISSTNTMATKLYRPAWSGQRWLIVQLIRWDFAIVQDEGKLYNIQG